MSSGSGAKALEQSDPLVCPAGYLDRRQKHPRERFNLSRSCGVGGDVIKFLELHEKVGFQDAVKQLAQRFGMTIPEPEQSDEQRAGTAEREALLVLEQTYQLVRRGLWVN